MLPLGLTGTTRSPARHLGCGKHEPGQARADRDALETRLRHQDLGAAERDVRVEGEALVRH